MQVVGVDTTFCQEGGMVFQSIAIEMGGVLRYLSKVSGSGVDLMVLNYPAYTREHISGVNIYCIINYPGPG